MVCGMVWDFHTIPHTKPSYHTIFYSMPFTMVSRINDNELLDSVLFEETDITYSFLKFGAFIMTRFDAMII